MPYFGEQPRPDVGPQFTAMNTGQSPYTPIFGQGMDIMNDPRNQWIGLPKFVQALPLLLGALNWTPRASANSYQVLSKTPDGFINFLKKLGFGSNEVSNIIGSNTMSSLVGNALRSGDNKVRGQIGDRLASYYNKGITRSKSLLEQEGINRKYGLVGTTEGTQQGNAAYQALSRNMGRMLDSPGFGERVPSSMPNPVTDEEYYDQIPIDRIKGK